MSSLLTYSRIFSTALFALTLTGAVQYSNKVGNGGDVVRCESQGTTRLLDFYEGDLKPSNSKGDSHLAVARRTLERLKEASPNLSKQYLNRLKELPQEIELKGGVELTDIPDSAHLYLPIGCQILQIAIRKPDVTSLEKRFLVREDLWKQLDSTHQAGLYTHEIIYEHLLKLGEEDSVKARKMNSYLYAANFDKAGFWKLIKELKIPIYP